MLEVRGITKRYGGELALDDVSLTIAPGTVHALVGANGAGKSTLGKVIAGAITPDAGEVRIDGEPAGYATPHAALQHGVALVAQELALAPDMTVVDNVFLAVEPRRRGLVDRAELRRRFDGLLERTGFAIPAEATVRELNPANQQKVEILRAINRRARIIVMDEPTSSLTRDEVLRLHDLIRDLRAADTTIVYVSHFLEEVLALADDVTILRNGRLVRSTPAAEETQGSIVVGMLGHASSAEYPERRPVAGDARVVLRADGLRREGVLDDVSLEIRAGEVLGIAGLVGSGRSELARAIFGADRLDDGTLAIDGREIAAPSPAASFAGGVAMVPESRKDQGLLMDQGVAANTTLPFLGDRAVGLTRRGGWLRLRDERERVGALLGDLAIKPASPDARVRTLSGGNQQKVLIGRCLYRSPRLLILDEPTRGVDVGARGAIHDLIGAFAGDGGAVLLISSDLEEVIGLAHRVLVMRRGAIVAELGADPPLDTVLQAAFGVPSDDGDLA